MDRESPGHPASRRGRHSACGQIYLVTIVTHHCEPLFSELAFGRLVTRELMRLDSINIAETLAYVLMPDHLHWLLRLQTPLTTVGTAVKTVKSRSARTINLLRRRQGRVWQPAFHDRALRSEEDVRDLARYIVANPLRAGLVERIGDYPLWDAIWL
jgi:putative transposase